MTDILRASNERLIRNTLMGTVKMIFGLGVIVMVAIVGINVIPPYFANYEFEDAIKNEALQATYTSRSEDDIRASIMKRAREYDIPVTEKQVRVVRVGSTGTGSISIEADYSVPINIPGYSTTLEFHPSSKNKGLY